MKITSYLKKSIIMCAIILLLVSTIEKVAFSQSLESNETTYKAYLQTDATVAIEDWKKAVTKSKQHLAKNLQDKSARYQLALIQFGLLNSTMRNQNKDLFDTYIEATEKNLESLISEYPAWGELSALKGALLGLQIAYSPWKGMFLGRESKSLLEKAKTDSPRSPLVWKLYANSKYFMPENWGGDVTEAIEAYKRSIELYDTTPDACRNNWFFLDTMAFLGQAYYKNGETAKAIAIYERALSIEPHLYWVKNTLLPNAKHK